MNPRNTYALLCCFLFIACGSSPESAGKKIAEGLCACRAEKQASAYKTMRSFKEDLDDGDFIGQEEAIARMKTLSEQVNKEADDCEARVSAEEDELLKEFLRDDDRGTIINAKRVVIEDCYREREAAMAEKMKELTELNTAIQQAIMKMPR